MISTVRVLTALAVFAVTFGGPARADEAALSAFFGNYVGRTISTAADGISERDLSVSIRSFEKGFTLDWTTITRNASGKVKRKAYSINFLPSTRENIYAAAMRKNMFGGSVPLDPLKGEPYVWSRITGRTLSVYAMLVTEQGGYEMQVYERSLSDSGLDLTFSRIRDGERLKQITGVLARVGD